jgi:hypothetical protein
VVTIPVGGVPKARHQHLSTGEQQQANAAFRHQWQHLLISEAVTRPLTKSPDLAYSVHHWTWHRMTEDFANVKRCSQCKSPISFTKTYSEALDCVV